jgi:hypothetical protein
MLFMKSILLYLLFIVAVVNVQAQNVTGIWRGHFNSSNRLSSLLNDDRYKFEVQIDQVNKLINGVTYSYHSTDFYAKASANGTVNLQTKKVILQELKIIEVKKGVNSFVCSMMCFLTWTKNGNEEFLEGTYTSTNTTDSTDCGKGTVFLRRVFTSDFYKEPFIVKREKEVIRKNQLANLKKSATPQPKAYTAKQPVTTTKPTTKPPVADNTKTNSNASKTVKAPEKNLESKPLQGIEKVDAEKAVITINKKPVLPPAPPVLKNRQNELVKTLTFTTKEITVQLYDNGTIDKDTVSVYLDNKLIVSKQMLTTNPITVNLNLGEDNNYHELVMVAENLGEIPPNTSLMVVKSGGKQYEVRITSTEQKNAMVIFKYQKE